MMTTIAEALFSGSERLAAVDENGAISYHELASRASQTTERLAGRRQLVLLECPATIDWLVAYAGVLKGGHVPLLLPPDAGELRHTIIERFRPNSVLLAADKFQPQLVNAAPLDLHPDLALLLSTSGSTGSPKCVRLSKDNVISNAVSICEYLGISQNDNGVVNLPAHYSYGLSIVNSHLLAGATLLLTGRSVVEPEFWEFCRVNNATSFGGVPYTYDLLSQIDFEAQAPVSLRYFTQAGGRLAPEKVRAFAAIAKRRGWQFFVMYGQTEASPRMSYLPPDRVMDHPNSIGVAVPSGQLIVRDESGQPVEDGTVGELCYRGPNVMMGYALSAEDLGLGKQVDELKTGDLAKWSPEGLLYITGRKSRFSKIYGNRIDLSDVEQIVAAAGYSGAAVTRDGWLTIFTSSARTGEIKELLAEKLSLPRHVLDVVFLEELPRLPSGKVDYATLTNKALSDTSVKDPLAGCNGRVEGIFQKIFGGDAKDTSKSFLDLGGDSLTYVRVNLALERALGHVPDNWVEMSVKDLAAGPLPGSAASIRPAVSRSILANADTLRVVACILVVVYHVVGASSRLGLQIADGSPYRFLIDDVFDVVRMPLYTALAGLLYAAMPTPLVSLPEFIKSRFLALIVPAVVVSLVYYGLRTTAGMEEQALGEALIHGYLHIWYLYALFLIVAAIACIDVLFKPGAAAWLLIAGALAFLSMLMPLPQVLALWAVVTLGPFFIIGLVLFRYAHLLYDQTTIVLAAVLATGGFAALFAGEFAGISIGVPQDVVLFATSSATIILLVACCPRLDWLEWIGLYSFAIYLWHPLCNSVVREALLKMGVDGTPALFVFGTLAGLFLPIALYQAAFVLPSAGRKALIGR